ncbi:hypothetical protein MA16_Dca020109 [Dendrobium catenatum]|uniref:Uncharacterized protein n=1 Tax=Dendrobium catenatum TaxID=906689 RepID=A0A2I0X3R0_9ASPA|nr:hypothetical protein MA16_Dca020109 [Dendrobium catenatum]
MDSQLFRLFLRGRDGSRVGMEEEDFWEENWSVNLWRMEDSQRERVMVSIALHLFRPNPDFVLLLPVVEPDQLDSFPCPPASHFVSFFLCTVA